MKYTKTLNYFNDQFCELTFDSFSVFINRQLQSFLKLSNGCLSQKLSIDVQRICRSFSYVLSKVQNEEKGSETDWWWMIFSDPRAGVCIFLYVAPAVQTTSKLTRLPSLLGDGTVTAVPTGDSSLYPAELFTLLLTVTRPFLTIGLSPPLRRSRDFSSAFLLLLHFFNAGDSSSSLSVFFEAEQSDFLFSIRCAKRQCTSNATSKKISDAKC